MRTLYFTAIIFAMYAAFFWRISAGESREHSVVQTGKSIVVKNGELVENAVSIGGDVIVQGEVIVDAVAIGGAIIVDSGAIINGNAITIGGEIQNNGVIRGEVIEISGPWVAPMLRAISPATWRDVMRGTRFLASIGFLVLALLIAVLFSRTIVTVAETVRLAFWRALLLGIAVPIGMIPIAALLAATVIGIIFIPLLIALILAGAFFGFIAVAYHIGNRIITALSRREIPAVWGTLAGLSILMLINLIPVAGWIIGFFVAIIGLGAVLESWIRARTARL